MKYSFAANSAWSAFQNGMMILQRYASHSSVDVESVARSNLQLLHRALSRDPTYTNNIEIAQNECAVNNLPTIRRLYANQGMHADLLSFQPGQSINLSSFADTYTMFLLISGSAQIDTQGFIHPTSQGWWKTRATANNLIAKKGITLKTGGVVIPSGQQAHRRLTARDKKCLLMKISINLTNEHCQMAS